MRRILAVPPLLVLSLLHPDTVGARDVLDARLRFLAAEHASPGASKRAAGDKVPVSIRFATVPTAEMIRRVEALGVVFLEVETVAARGRPGSMPVGGRWLRGTRTVLPARAPWPALRPLSEMEGVVRVETAWSPTRRAPLYQTRILSGAEDAWDVGDGQGGPLWGTGVRIADIDSGADVFHPDLWAADGDTIDWIDADASGGWSEGDGVDVNGNDVVDADEKLRFVDAPGGAPGMGPGLQIAIDAFYQDLDDDGQREFGLAFTESDPTFGEPVFRALDENSNHQLDVGERLVALRTPKVEAVYQTDGTVRRAGVDLIQSEGDGLSHGTQVSSIHVGGERGRRFGGLAPGARLLLGNIFYDDDFALTPMEDRMTWAASEGADVLVYEIGGWVWEFLDGSSNVETMIDELAQDGIVQIVPAGNLATGGMHWQGDLGASPGDSLVAELVSISPASDDILEIYGDFYCRPDFGDSVGVQLQTPADDTLVLGGAGTTVTVGDFDVYHASDVSPRGTVRVDFQISLAAGSASTRLDGTWTFVLRRVAVGSSSLPLTVHGMTVDNTSGWFGNSTWTDAEPDNTVTWPATADSAITVAAYNPNTGGLNSFSGRGVRVDGFDLVDVTAPGTLTYTALRNEDRGGVAGGYGAFGGTSAAAPHVAASAAILLQWEPAATPGWIRWLLRQGAVSDAQTGPTPNSAWGAGKLQVYESLLVGLAPVRPPVSPRGSRVTVRPNVPNPFNPVTEIRYTLPSAGEVVVTVYDLRGRRVRALHEGAQIAGEHALRWDGHDDRHHPVASGVYLVQVTLDGDVASRKITLVR